MRTIFSVVGNLVALTAALGLLARYISPQTFWPPVLIALILPGVLVLTLLFLLIQLYRRKWRSAFFPAIVLLYSLTVVDRLYAWPKTTPAPAEGAKSIVLATGNQRLFRRSDFNRVDTGVVRKFFADLGADIVLLQEVYPATNRQNFIPSILAAPELRERHQEFGTLIATYAGSVRPVTTHFSATSEYHGFVVTDVPTPIGTVRVINAHLESNKISDMAEGMGDRGDVGDQVKTFGKMLAGYARTTRRRAAQAQDIRGFVEESPYPVVLGGDFNDVPSSFIYHELHSPRLRDAWVQAGSGLGTTFTGPIPGLRIDYFMVDTALSVVDIARVESPWSDHRMLRMTLTK